MHRDKISERRAANLWLKAWRLEHAGHGVRRLYCRDNGEPCEPFAEKRAGTKELKTIRTNAVEGILGYPKKPPAKGDVVLIDVLPVVGEVIATVKFTGAGCKLTSTTIEGSVAGEAWANAKEGVKIEEKETEAESSFVNFAAAPVKLIFIETEKGELLEIKPSLKVGALGAELVGRTEIKLVSKEKWGVFTK
jgi:hypothetical protein